MLQRVTKRDIVWAFLAQFMQFGSSIFLLPVVLRRLPVDDLGIWYIYTMIWSFVLLLDSTFSQTILRNIAYVFAGARVLLRSGIVAESKAAGIDYDLLYHVEHTCRLIYATVALIALVGMASAGTYYVFTVGRGIDQRTLIISWAIFVVSVVFRLYYAYLDPFLRGSGKVAQSNQSIFYSRLANLVLSIALVLGGMGLVGVAAANLASSVVGRVLSRRYYYTAELKKHFRGLRSDRERVRGLFLIMWYNSWRTGVVAVGTFFLTKSSTFLASVYLGLQMTARVGLSVQVADLLLVLSSVVGNTFQTEFTALSKLGKRKELLRKFSVSWLVSIVTFVAGSVGVLIAGTPILSMIRSNTTLLNAPALALLLLTNLLGLNHMLFANLIVAKNEMPFVKPGLLSGIATLLLTIGLLRFTRLGEIALVLSQLVVQLTYNNWRWPYLVLKEHRTSVLWIARLGFGTILQYFSRGRERPSNPRNDTYSSEDNHSKGTGDETFDA